MLEKLTEAGTKLGLTGNDLRDFVTAQQTLLRTERQLERDEAKAEHERKLKLIAEEDKLKALEHERQMTLLAAKSKIPTVSEPGSKGPKPPKLPYFNEVHDDMDSYLQRFERYAETQKWKPEIWAVNLSALLRGKALEVYARLPTADALDYGKLKYALLQRFELTEEGFKKKFRGAKPESGETFVQFSARIRNYFNRWVEFAHITKSYEGLVDMLMREQILFVCGPELRLFLKERVPTSLDSMVKLADQYCEARGGNILNVLFKRKEPKPDVLTKENKSTSQPVRKSMDLSKFADMVCRKCKVKGHIERYCTSRVTAALSEVDRDSHVKEDQELSCCVASPVPVVNSFVDSHPGVCGTRVKDCYTCPVMGVMPVRSGRIEGHESDVTVLRDTGCSGVCIRKDLVPPSAFLVQDQQCKLIDGTIRTFPLASVFIDTPFYKGRVEAMVMDNLLYDIVVGQITGAREPNDPDPNWNCAQSQAVTTRAQARRRDAPAQPLRVPKWDQKLGDVTEFKKAQSEDGTLKYLHQKAQDGIVHTNDKGKVVEMKYKSGLLYRSFHSPTVRNDRVFTQLIVPKPFRTTVLKYAHECIFAGHMGRRKTADRLLVDFYWPGVYVYGLVLVDFYWPGVCASHRCL